MDRKALVARNRAMAEAYHRIPFKHRLRRVMLRSLGVIPFMPVNTEGTPRILVIRPDHLGDMLLTTPAIHALKAAQPLAEIHALVGPWSAGALANYPEIDVALTLAFPGFTRNPKDSIGSPYQTAISASRMLRKIGYESAVIFRPDHWWGAMLAHLAGIRQIIGYDLPDVAPFLTDPVAYKDEHVVRQNMRLVEYWTGSGTQAQFRFPVDAVDKGFVQGYLEAWDITPDTDLICIHPGSGTWVKRWDDSRWAVVADTLADQLNAQIVITGSDHEFQLAKAMADEMTHKPCIMTGDTQIGQLAALYARSRVVLGPDSGPLHLAAAVGTPTVTLFGPARVQEFGPWGPPEKHIALTSDIGCIGCGILDWEGDAAENHPCMQDITVGRVLEAARLVAHYSKT